MKKKQSSIIIAIVAAVFLLLLFGNGMFYKIKPGERAIIFRQFSTGLDTVNVYLPGFHVVAPWNDFIVYNVKERKSEETMDVLDKNGLQVNIDISVRFNPIYNRIAFLHRRFGVDYESQLVVPEVRSTVRQVAGRYTAEEIYSTKRSEVELRIIEEAGQKLSDNDIDMKALLIRSINLPPDIKQAIESKLKQEQEALAYEFKLEKEKSEAQRKIIQAQGEAKSNRIINNSLTDELLRMRGIEATIELSKSPNAKTIVIGGGKDGLPLILGNQ
ncbi:MAG: prohibitin family protein [Bacteroidetes bacterium]|nr:MAG: prohibitin family protein [Bacteroidota bacterium]